MLSARTARLAIAAAATTTLAVSGASRASAHIGVDKDEVVAGQSTTLSLSFSHGCGDSPTNSIRVQIPEQILNATPQVHPGWDITVEREALDAPVESGHGDPVTDRPAVITFTAQPGSEVPNGHRDTVTLSFRAPEDPGVLYFKTIQGCVDGQNDWIAEWDGTGPEPESPAPSVTVVESAGADVENASASAAADGGTGSGNESGSDSAKGIAIAGVVVGAAGLVAGGTAIAMSRRSRTIA